MEAIARKCETMSYSQLYRFRQVVRALSPLIGHSKADEIIWHIEANIEAIAERGA